MKSYRIFIYVLLLLQVSCNDEYTTIHIPVEDAANIVGNWYVEDNSLEKFSEYTYTNGGNIYIDSYSRMYGYKRVQEIGTYSHSGKSLVHKIESAGGMPVEHSYELHEITALSFRTSSVDYGNTDYCRIIGVVDILVDEMIELDVLQYIKAYTPDSVEVCGMAISNSAVADIDDSGAIRAKRKGIAYLKVETSIGTAVLKISVTDNANLWIDVSKALGMRMVDVEVFFGSYYAFVNDSSALYFYDDYYVDYIEIHANRDVADSIIVSLNKEVGPAEVKDYLDNRFCLVKDSMSCRWYTDNDNFLFSTYSVRYEYDKSILTYTHLDVEWDDRIDDYGLTFDDLVKKYGVYRANDGNLHFDVDNDFISRIMYSFTNEKVSSYSVDINMDVETRMVNEYLQKSYKRMNSVAEYVRNIQINGKEMLLQVTTSTDKHSLFFWFYDNN